MNKPFKFRVSYRLIESGVDWTEEKSFSHFTLAQAKRHYKMIALGLYKHKKLRRWEICLNRELSKEWEFPLYFDAKVAE